MEIWDGDEMEPTQVSQPVLGNQIARAEPLEEYFGSSDRAMEAVTEDDRKRARNWFTDS